MKFKYKINKIIIGVVSFIFVCIISIILVISFHKKNKKTDEIDANIVNKTDETDETMKKKYDKIDEINKEIQKAKTNQKDEKSKINIKNIENIEESKEKSESDSETSNKRKKIEYLTYVQNEMKNLEKYLDDFYSDEEPIIWKLKYEDEGIQTEELIDEISKFFEYLYFETLLIKNEDKKDESYYRKSRITNFNLRLFDWLKLVPSDEIRENIILDILDNHKNYYETEYQIIDPVISNKWNIKQQHNYIKKKSKYDAFVRLISGILLYLRRIPKFRNAIDEDTFKKYSNKIENLKKKFEKYETNQETWTKNTFLRLDMYKIVYPRYLLDNFLGKNISVGLYLKYIRGRY